MHGLPGSAVIHRKYAWPAGPSSCARTLQAASEARASRGPCISKKQTLEALVRLIGRVPKASPVFRTCRNRCLECQPTCSCTGCSSVHSQSRVRASRSAPGPSAHMVARCECGATRRSPPGRPCVESRNPGMTPGPLGTCWLAWRGVSQPGYDARPWLAWTVRQERPWLFCEPQCVR